MYMYMYMQCTCFDSNRWWVNPDLLVHVDVSRETIEAGDYVVTGTDPGLTRRIQKHSGMWQDGMEKVSVGQLMSAAVGMLRVDMEN